MKNGMKVVMLLFFSLIILPGCSNGPDVGLSDMEKQFSTIVPVADMNQSLIILVDGKENIFQSASDIPIIINNKSQKPVFLDVNSYVKLLVYTDSQWIETKNAITYSGTLLLSPQGTVPFDETYTWAQPILDKNISNTSNSEILLRIVVIGEFMEGEVRTGENIGAFVDVVLKP